MTYNFLKMHLHQHNPYFMEQATGDIGLHVNADKTEYMCFNKNEDASTLNGGS